MLKKNEFIGKEDKTEKLSDVEMLRLASDILNNEIDKHKDPDNKQMFIHARAHLMVCIGMMKEKIERGNHGKNKR